MPINHTCSDKCFTKRTAAKNISHCRECDHRCNLQCFGFSSNAVFGEIHKDSNILFVCTKCYHNLFTSKLRRSITKSVSVSGKSAAPSVDGVNKSKNDKSAECRSKYDNDNENPSNVASALNSIKDRFDSMEQNIIANITKISESINSNIVDKSTATDNHNKLMNELMKNSHTLSKLATIEHLKDSVANICTSIDKKTQKMIDSTLDTSNKSHSLFKSIFLNNNDSSRNALDFSFSVLNDSANQAEYGGSRPSVIVQQTIDDSIVDIIKRSDETTWRTLDILNAEIKTLSDRLTDIQNNLKSYSPQIDSITQTRSPLVESIMHENLDKILAELNDLNVKSTAFFDYCSLGQSSSTSTSTNNIHATTQSQDMLTNSLLYSELGKCVDRNLEFAGNSNSNKNTISKRGGINLHTDIDDSSDVNASNITALDCSLIHDISGVHIDGNGTENIDMIKVNKLELYLTNLPTNITDDDIFYYVKNKGILNVDDIKLHKLVKRNADLATLSFVSYKIDTIEKVAERLCEDGFWPDKCIIKTFVQKNQTSKPKNNAKVASAQNFRLPKTQPALLT